jgi:hypothetical protein
VHFPHSPTDDRNGLFCCRDCDKYLEDHDIEIEPDGRLTISDMLQKDPSKGKKYKKLHGHKVKWAHLIGTDPNFPTAELLAWRKTLPISTSARKLVLEFGLSDDESEADDESESKKPAASSKSVSKKRVAPGSSTKKGRSASAKAAKGTAGATASASAALMWQCSICQTINPSTQPRCSYVPAAASGEAACRGRRG